MELDVKKNYVYIMMDKKADDLALVKCGQTTSTLRDRFHAYKTSNPFLECVAISEVKKTYSLNYVEDLMHFLCDNHKQLSFLCGEWYVVRGKEEIEKIQNKGFLYFRGVNSTLKNKEMVNQKICEMWGSAKRPYSRTAYVFKKNKKSA